MKSKTIYRLSLMSAAAILAAGCSGSSGGGNGTLNLGLTDGPVEGATAVVIAFTGVELKPANGAPLDPIAMDENSCDTWDAATETCSIDVLSLTGTDRRVVFSESIPAGEYQWIRLMVNAEQNVMDSYIEFGGEMCSLWMPSGSETGLKIHNAVTVTANGVSDYTLDFELKQSVKAPPGFDTFTIEACTQNYVMRPTIRMIDSTEVGHIAGTVDSGLLATSESCTMDGLERYDNASVYVFEDFDGNAVAEDMDPDPTYPGPITTANVVWNDAPDVMAYEYEVGFLLSPNDYLVALTCDGGADNVDVDDFDPDDAGPQSFGFIAEQVIPTQVSDVPVDGSFIL